MKGRIHCDVIGSAINNSIMIEICNRGRGVGFLSGNRAVRS